MIPFLQLELHAFPGKHTILSIKLIKGKRRRKFSRLRENSWSVSLPSSLPSLSLVANGFLPALESSCALWMQLRRASWKKYLKTFYDSAPPPPLSTTVIEKPGRNNHSRLKIKFFSSFFIIIITICLFFSLNKYLARCETIDSWSKRDYFSFLLSIAQVSKFCKNLKEKRNELVNSINFYLNFNFIFWKADGITSEHRAGTSWNKVNHVSGYRLSILCIRALNVTGRYINPVRDGSSARIKVITLFD